MKRHLGGFVVPALTVLLFCLAACEESSPGDGGPGGGGSPGQPLTISALKASIGGDGIIALSWTETGTDGRVEISWSPDSATAKTVAAGIATYSATGLQDDTEYDFTLTSVDGDGGETATLTASAVTAPDGAVFISDADGLAAVNGALGGYYVLLKDIDLTGRSFTPIGTTTSSWFSGTFDGNGKEVANLAIESTGGFIGLFGVSAGIVMNLGVTNVDLSGGLCVGGLVGLNYGHVDNCYSTGSINATGNYIGGLVGNAMGILTRSYSTCAVRGYSAVGGLLGSGASMTVANCYAAGDVSGNNNIGGLIGYMYGYSTSNCYAIGTVSGSSGTGGLIGGNEGTVAVCYFNNLNTGNSVGTASMLDDMKLQATYVDWDFADIWGIEAGKNSGFPYLRSMNF